MVADEGFQVFGSLRAVVCGSKAEAGQYDALDPRSPRADAREKGKLISQKGIFGKNCHVLSRTVKQVIIFRSAGNSRGG